jgi:predicted membrane protein
MSSAITEPTWVFLVVWVFLTVFGHVKRDEILRMLAGLVGIVFGIMYLRTGFILALGMVLINLYLLYDAISDD